MNVDTGHLINSRMMEAMDAERREYYTTVPLKLQGAASRILGGTDEAYVSLTSGGKLSRFAAAERKKKRKAQKVARRNNR